MTNKRHQNEELNFCTRSTSVSLIHRYCRMVDSQPAVHYIEANFCHRGPISAIHDDCVSFPPCKTITSRSLGCTMRVLIFLYDGNNRSSE